MVIGRVIGSVVAAAKVKPHEGHKLLLVQPEKEDGSPEDRTWVAVDLVQAGEGDRVLLMREGSSVRDMLGVASAPIHAAIVGIIDEVSKQ